MSVVIPELQNFVWKSLTGKHQHLSLGTKGARRYLADVSPFVALRETHANCLKDLAELVQPGELVLLRTDVPEHQGEWKLESQLSTVQMVLAEQSNASTHASVRQLSASDVPAMLELTNLVLPGFFRKRGIEMGSFYGIFDSECVTIEKTQTITSLEATANSSQPSRPPRLIAMAGERVFPKPYREITAVCTHPDFQGRGHAATLVQHVAANMRAEGLKPFLNTGTANARAIALYKRLGFVEVGNTTVHGLRRL